MTTAEKRAYEYACSYAEVDEDGAISENGVYYPESFCEILEKTDFQFSRFATRVKRDGIKAVDEQIKKEREPLFEVFMSMMGNIAILMSLFIILAMFLFGH